jgi:hypothetical protein
VAVWFNPSCSKSRTARDRLAGDGRAWVARDDETLRGITGS